MPAKKRLMRPSRSSPMNGIQISIKITGGMLKKSSMVLQKLMKFFQIGIEEPTMTKSIIKITLMKMLTKLLSVSMKSMLHRMKMKESSFKLITQTEEEITMKLLDWGRMLIWTKLKKLIESLLSSTTQRTTTTAKSQERDLMRLMRPITHFQHNQEDIIMIHSNLVRLLLLELRTSSKISGETDSTKYNRQMSSSNQFWEINGVENWIKSWEEKALRMTGAMLSKDNQQEHKLTTQTEMEFNQRNQSQQEPESRMECPQRKPPNNMNSLMETDKSARSPTMVKEM